VALDQAGRWGLVALAAALAAYVLLKAIQRRRLIQICAWRA